MAVLYRTDAQAVALGQALTRAGLPFQKRSHDLLGRRAAVLDILREMALAGGQRAGGDAAGDPAAGAAVAGAGPGETDRGRAWPGEARAGGAGAVGQGGPGPGEAHEGAGEPVAGAGVAGRLRAAVHALSARSPGRRASGDGPSPVDVLAAGEVLAPLARRCGDDFERFLTEIALGAEVDALDPRADAVTLLTIHAAKGLEFGVVIVAGCERDLLPLWLPGKRAGRGPVSGAGPGADGTALEPGGAAPGAGDTGPGASGAPAAAGGTAPEAGGTAPEGGGTAPEGGGTGTAPEGGGTARGTRGTDLAEERRLLFVAMTRARSHLFLTCAARRRRHSKVVDTGPSPFLASIDPRLLDRPAAPRPRPRRPEMSQPRLL